MRAGACSDLRVVFVEGDVSDPVEFVFDAPLSSIEFEQSLGVSLLRRETRDAVDCF